MSTQNSLNRRGFVGGVVTALGYLTVKSPAELWAQARGNGGQPRPQRTTEDYDLGLVRESGGTQTLVAFSNNDQADYQQQPTEYLCYTNPDTVDAFYGIVIWMYHDEIHHSGVRTFMPATAAMRPRWTSRPSS